MVANIGSREWGVRHCCRPWSLRLPSPIMSGADCRVVRLPAPLSPLGVGLPSPIMGLHFWGIRWRGSRAAHVAFAGDWEHPAPSRGYDKAWLSTSIVTLQRQAANFP